MNKFKYWAHRLVPHLAFDDFIERAENVGGKKPIKVEYHFFSIRLLLCFFL